MTWHRIDDPENPPPKDGTQVLVFSPRGISIAEESRGQWMALAGKYDWAFDGEEIIKVEPTHWQHLPDPPKE